MDISLEQAQDAAINNLMTTTKPSRTLVGACFRWLRAKVVRATITPVTKLKLWVDNSPSKIVQTIAKVVTKVANVVRGVIALTIGGAMVLVAGAWVVLGWTWLALRTLGLGVYQFIKYIPQRAWEYIRPTKVVNVEAEPVAQRAKSKREEQHDMWAQEAYSI
jgi:hypothetical protein